MARHRHLTELQQREHLALRFGLGLRRPAGPSAERPRPGPSLRRALAVPYYGLLHHGNVVPRAAPAQRGRLRGVLAVQVPAPGSTIDQVIEGAERIARVLMAELEAPGAVYSVRAADGDQPTGRHLLVVDAAASAGGPMEVPLPDDDLDPLLRALFRTVEDRAGDLAIVRDPVAVREDPGSLWRWLVPLRDAGSAEEFAELHRRMSFEVLTALVGAEQRELAPLKSVPSWYLAPE